MARHAPLAPPAAVPLPPRPPSLTVLDACMYTAFLQIVCVFAEVELT